MPVSQTSMGLTNRARPRRTRLPAFGLALAIGLSACGNRPEAAVSRGHDALAKGEAEAACAAFAEAAQAAPEDADVQNAWAAAEALAGRGQAAIARLYRAIELRDDFPEARLFLARLLHEMGGMEAARRHVEHVLVRHPARPEALTAAAAVWADDPAMVAAWLQKAAEAEPENLEWRLRFAHALLAAGGLEEATRAFASLVETPGIAVEAYRGLADVWRLRGNPDLQVAALTLAAKRPEAGLTVKTDLARAMVAHPEEVVQAKGAELAFALLDQAPEDPDLNFIAATLFDDFGADEDARLHYLTAVANGCDNPRASLYLGESYAKTGEPGKAREVLAAVAEAEPEDSPWRARAIALIGSLP